MISRTSNFVLRTLLAALLMHLPLLAAQSSPGDVSKTSQKGFLTPQEAAKSLIVATKSYDVEALLQIFGAEGEDFVSSADPVRDKNNGLAFAELAAQKNSVVVDPKNSNRATIVVGNNDWPLPVPLVKKGDKWFFDSKAGRQEILYRRIGANELDAIQVCRGYVEAQKEYASEIHDDSGVNQYAQKIISTPGKHDGLFWLDANGSPAGPIGEEVAKALSEGYQSKADPYHGYYFKILKGQGPAAPLGKLDYVIEGIMIGGFALVAAPAEYRVTGVKTFIVSNDGVVYQKDLGPKSLEIFKNMEVYNPDKTWSRTDDQWLVNAWSSAP
jgi:hypothetical protein